ncbi:MAG: hypothetical protein ACOX04_00680 [Candidatus Scatomorpha sp.]|jgi:hypothetical protein
MCQAEIFDDFLYLLALKFFCESGHTDVSEAVFANHTPEQVVYFDSGMDISLSRTQRDILKNVTNISHIFDIKDVVFEEPETGSVSFYSIELLSTKQCRSQDAYDTHCLLRTIFAEVGSIILFRDYDELMLSVQGCGSDVYLSDWFHQDDDFELWAERINICGMSLRSAGDFISDFIYNSARYYFIYPITVETAVYTMLPENYFSKLKFYGEKFYAEDFKETICEYLRIAEIEYGDDYVKQGNMETLSTNVGTELDLLALEIEEEGDLISVAEGEDDFSEDEYAKDEYEFSDIDEEILQDPILMLKYIKQKM